MVWENCTVHLALSLTALLSLQELGVLQDYLLALTTDDHLLRCAAQVLSPPQQSWPPGCGATISPLPGQRRSAHCV